MSTFFSSPFFDESKASIRLAIPLILSEWFYSISGVIFTWMTTRLGAKAVAASVLNFSVFLVMIMLIAGMSVAVSVVISQSVGENNREGIRQGFVQSAWMTLFVSLATLFVFWVGPYILPFIIHGDKDLLSLVEQMMHSFLWLVFPVCSLIVMEKVFTGLQRPRMVLFFSIMTVPLEVLCNYAFVFGQWGFPKCGIRGFGYGYALASTIINVIFLLFMCLDPQLKELQLFSAFKRFDTKYLKALWQIGWPMMILFIVETSAFSLMTFIMARFGASILGAYQIARQFWIFAAVAVFALAETTAVRVSYFVGQGKKKPILTVFYANLTTGAILTSILVAVMMSISPFIVHYELNSADPQTAALIRYFWPFLVILMAFVLVDAFRLVATGGLRGLKDTKIILWSSIVCFWLVGVPAAYGLSFIWNYKGLWLGMGIGAVLSAAMLICAFLWRYKRTSLEDLAIK